MQRQNAIVATIAIAVLLAAGGLMGQEPEEGAVGDPPRDTREAARTDEVGSADGHVHALSTGWPLPRGDVHATGASGGRGPTAPVVQWRHDTGEGPTATSVADAGGTVYLASFGRSGVTVRALDSSNGDEIWVFRRDQRQIVSALASSDGLLYATTADSSVIALDQDTGEVIAEFRGSDEVSKPTRGLLPLPDSRLLLSQRTEIRCVAEDLSEVLWSWRDPGYEGEQIMGPGPLSLTRSGEALTTSGALHALDPGDGHVKWRYDAGEFSLPSFAAVDAQNRVFWRGTSERTPGASRELLTCVEGDTGRLLWSQEHPGGYPPAPAISEDRVVLTKGSQVLSCRSASDGELLWSVQLPHFRGSLSALSGPVIDVDGRVYAASGDSVVCYALEDGQELFRERVSPSLHHMILPGDGSLLVVNSIGSVYSLQDGDNQAAPGIE